MAHPIIDSHCHAWRRWPYRPEVPDFESRGTVEQLLWEMDQAGVEQAAVVCAEIEHNPDDNEYVAACVKRFPARLHQIADVDCSWSSTYHTPGAADRLRAAADTYPLKGFTHYVKSDDDGSWFLSEEGRAFFGVAEERHLIASIAVAPRLQPVLCQAAERFPSVPFLFHHMGQPKATEPPPYPVFRTILAGAATPNVYVKLSGFHYASPVSWEYPYSDCGWLVRGLYEHFGPDRLCWGSDYPVVRRAMTYRQSLEAVRTHCPFIPPEHKARILGGTLARLLGQS
jgi:predicted TIM-barrel fold metal-dependent hydrolase